MDSWLTVCIGIRDHGPEADGYQRLGALIGVLTLHRTTAAALDGSYGSAPEARRVGVAVRC